MGHPETTDNCTEIHFLFKKKLFMNPQTEMIYHAEFSKQRPIPLVPII